MRRTVAGPFCAAGEPGFRRLARTPCRQRLGRRRLHCRFELGVACIIVSCEGER